MQPGDIGVCHGTGIVDRVIEFGERLHGAGRDAKWSHAFVVVSAQGDTIEAQAFGVVRSTVASHGPDVRIFDCPAGVDRQKVVATANKMLGVEYGYGDDFLLGIDCLPHWTLDEHGDSVICSELAAMCLVAGGWKSPLPPALTMPSDIAAALG